MKRLFSILCLSAILMQSFSSLYVICSFFLNREEISRNRCENRFAAMPICKGKCFLNKELKQQEEQQKQFPEFKLKDLKLICCNGFQLTEKVIQPLLLSEGYIAREDLYAYTKLSSIFHPPLLG